MSDRRVVVVTGASQGIGRELAVAFAAAGDTVVLAARNKEGLEATAEAVSASGGDPFVAPADVTDPMLMTEPALCSIILGRKARLTRKTPKTLTAKVPIHSSGSISHILPDGPPTPLLLTSASTRP